MVKCLVCGQGVYRDPDPLVIPVFRESQMQSGRALPVGFVHLHHLETAIHETEGH